jgi:hypothetical protein
MKIFDDIFSFFHALMGVFAALAPFPHNAFIIFLFVIYEVIESRTKAEIFYDVIEFIVGYVFIATILSIIRPK